MSIQPSSIQFPTLPSHALSPTTLWCGIVTRVLTEEEERELEELLRPAREEADRGSMGFFFAQWERDEEEELEDIDPDESN